MLRIAITLPDALADEPQRIADLLDSGTFDLVHLRKPGWDVRRYEALLAAIPTRLHGRLVLHDHHALALRYAVRGIHLNSRNPEAPEGYEGQVSRSCHSIDEVLCCKAQYAYVFLSPIFDSVSKVGYMAAFRAEELESWGRQGALQPNVIALGGVTPERLDQIEAWGFAGAAMLGAAWREPLPASPRGGERQTKS